MKYLVKILASVIIIPLLLIVVISGSLKFQILNENFWINTFNKNNVYLDIQNVVLDYLDSKNGNIFADLVVHENVKDFTDKNLIHVMGFLKGQTSELTFYIPVKKIPKEMLPKKMGTLKEKMTARELIQKFNIGGVDPIIFDQFRITGQIVDYVFYISLVLSILLILLAHPVAIAFSGLLLFAQTFLTTNIVFNGNKLVEVIFLPIIIEISKTWKIVGLIIILLSILIFITKKYIIKHKNG